MFRTPEQQARWEQHLEEKQRLAMIKKEHLAPAEPEILKQERRARKNADRIFKAEAMEREAQQVQQAADARHDAAVARERALQQELRAMKREAEKNELEHKAQMAAAVAASSAVPSKLMHQEEVSELVTTMKKMGDQLEKMNATQERQNASQEQQQRELVEALKGLKKD